MGRGSLVVPELTSEATSGVLPFALDASNPTDLLALASSVFWASNWRVCTDLARQSLAFREFVRIGVGFLLAFGLCRYRYSLRREHFVLSVLHDGSECFELVVDVGAEGKRGNLRFDHFPILTPSPSLDKAWYCGNEQSGDSDDRCAWSRCFSRSDSRLNLA
jgi:hypothetical protein